MIFQISSTDAIDWNTDPIGQIKNNIVNILNTRRFEIPFMRDMGILQDYIDKPITETQGQIISDVIDNIQAYEPRVNIKEVVFLEADENGEINISVVIEI